MTSKLCIIKSKGRVIVLGSSSNSRYNYTVPKAKSDLFACEWPNRGQNKTSIFNLDHDCIICNGSLMSNAIINWYGRRAKGSDVKYLAEILLL